MLTARQKPNTGGSSGRSDRPDVRSTTARGDEERAEKSNARMERRRGHRAEVPASRCQVVAALCQRRGASRGFADGRGSGGGKPLSLTGSRGNVGQPVSYGWASRRSAVCALIGTRHDMTSASSRSLDYLEREAEQNRAVLVDTVDALRATVLGEVEDVRRKVSFDYLGAEIRNQVRANPLRSFAIGAGLTLPLWRMGRRIPMPLLLIGAGVALARPSTKNAIAGAANTASAHVGQLGARSGDALGSAWDGAKGTGAQASQKMVAGLETVQKTVRETKNDVVARVGDLLGTGSEAASNAAGQGANALQSGADQLTGARDYATRKVTETRSQAVDLFYDNPLLVAGAGLALGALLAAIVPATETEGQLLEKVAPDLKQKATDLVDQGYETVRDAAGDIYEGAVVRAKEQWLSP